MTSVFQIGESALTLTSLDELTTPLPDPQWEFHEYREMSRLANFRLRGLGPQTVLWSFPMLETAQIAQLKEFIIGAPIYIQTLKQNDTLAVFEVEMNILEPVQDGEHKPGFKGWRMGFDVEFVVKSEVT